MGVICGCLHGVRAVVSLSPGIFSSEYRENHHPQHHYTNGGAAFETIDLRNRCGSSTLRRTDQAWIHDVLGSKPRHGASNIVAMELNDRATLKRSGSSRSDCMGVNTWITTGSRDSQLPKTGIELTTEVMTEYGCGPSMTSRSLSLKARNSADELIVSSSRESR
ncbi:hypothetical protein EJ05DRAFT_202482 [Pseudovirgaria hyperparasitica]|uniref:Uncharacterized protein n=1 Tax=Pseudovirgaria hyperparasitica TaxID=470096 RepID=A0A6A6WJ74_9PEZI|nr:uncharacterized protein EJ05DRAFT_202482 [Pseudovirgaria hyperparasitica]KAF2762255.1 hypothetical protein EJ05DRAFT_202482 [Pseudovirgaria hyperparasitica]